MGFHTFGPLLVIDSVTLAPSPGVVGTVVDATTETTVATYNMSGTPVSLVTNARGYVGQFQAPDTSVMLRLTFGDMTLDVVAKEAIASGGGVAGVSSVDGQTGAVSLSSTYVAQADAGQNAASKLRLKSGPVAVGVAGDSTGNAATEWVDVWAGLTGTDDADLRVEIPHWNTTTSTYDAATVVQAGSTGYATKIHDTFTRTAADLYGTTPDIGGAWGGDSNAPGDYSIDGSAAVATADGTRGIAIVDPQVPGDATITVTGVMSTVTGGVAHNDNWYLAYLDGSNHLFSRLTVTTGGNASFTLYKRIANVPTSLGTIATAALSNTSDQAYTLTMSMVGDEVTATYNGQTVTATLAGGDVAALGTKAGINTGKAGNTVTEFTMQVAAASRTMTVYNASVPGSTLAVHQAALATMFPVPLDLLIINSGHNYGTQTAAQYEAALDAFVAAARAAQPTAGILITSQNPQKPPALRIVEHLTRQAALRSYCARRGYGYLPALEAFYALPDEGITLIMADGVHPTQGAGSGSELWAGVMHTYMTAV